jgi:alpha,alpha-trehalase
MRGWWDADLGRADEQGIIKDATPEPPTQANLDNPASKRTLKTLIFLPFPFSSGGGSVASFPEMYGWDIFFINLGLLAHGRTDIARWNILDQLFMIDRFGKVLNSNRFWNTGRGQPPLLAWSVENYLAAKQDEELALRAYPSLEREYTDYWNAPGHITPIGLSTCRDMDPKDTLTEEQDAECEAGLDFTPIFGGDVRRCVPIHINTALVRYAQVMGNLAERFNWSGKAAAWRKKADERAALINKYCWDEQEGFYFEYDYVSGKRLPYYSVLGFWPLWTGIASKDQARRVVDHLKMFDHPHGLTFTDRAYPGVHPEFKHIEWAYPQCWPQQQIAVAQALQRYGYRDLARDISRRYMANVIATWEKTGLTWERYDALAGGHNVPVERDPAQPLHGFTSASAVVVGRIAFS